MLHTVLLFHFLDLDTPVISGSKHVTTREGTNLFLTCSNKGYPTVIYKWNFNGNFLSNGSKLFIPSLKNQDSGNYTCVAMNIFKTMESSPVMLKVTCKYKYKSFSNTIEFQFSKGSKSKCSCSDPRGNSDPGGN